MANPPARPRIPAGVWSLGWVSLLTDVASDMVYPLLPEFLTRTLGAGPKALGLIEGVAEATASLVKLVSGRIADRLPGKKSLVVAGYALAALARPMVSFAARWSEVLLIRFADRVGKGLRTPPRDALLAGLAPAEARGRAFGLQRAMDNAGALLGPLLAALLMSGFGVSPRGVFLLAAIPGAIAVLVLLFGVHEARPAPRRAPREPLPSAPLPPRVRTAIALFALFTLAGSSDAFLLLRARELGIPAAQLPLLWAALHLVKTLAGTPLGALSDRIGRIPSIAAGWFIYALSYLGFALAPGAAAVSAVFLFYGLYFAFCEGPERALLADLAPAELRGRSFGAFHAAVGACALPASLLFGVLWERLGARGAFLCGAGLAFLATLLLLAASRSGRL